MGEAVILCCPVCGSLAIERLANELRCIPCAEVFDYRDQFNDPFIDYEYTPCPASTTQNDPTEAPTGKSGASHTEGEAPLGTYASEAPETAL